MSFIRICTILVAHAPHVIVYVEFMIEKNPVFFADRPGLTDPRKVESLTNKVINSLKEHTTYHPQAKNKQNYFARTVEKLQTVQVLRQEGRQKLFYLILELRNMGHPVHIPPIVEEIASQVH